MGTAASVVRCLIAVAALLSASAHAATNYIEILDATFNPDQLAIRVRDTVVWLQNDSAEHTVTSDDGLFDSGTLFEDEFFSYTFEEAGRFPYYCDFHGFPGGGMSGVIQVFEPGENPAPATPGNIAPINGSAHQPLTVQLTAGPFADADPRDFHAASQWIVRRASDNQVVFDSGEDFASRTSLGVPEGKLAFGVKYAWQVRYRDGLGEWSDYSTATTFTTLVPTLANGVGLKASYHNVAGFTSPLAIATNATVAFDWGQNRPHRRITADAFAVRWEGSILPEFTEQYEIQFQYHGRARVWVNNQLLVDEWNGCSFSQTRRGSVALVGGQLAMVRVEYAADPQEAMAHLRWESARQSIQVIPQQRLFPASP
jgi:plastocyanin